MRRSTTVRQRVGMALGLGISLLAILLWGKLKLVAGVPRTAYADPKAAPAATHPPAAHARAR